MNQGHVDPQSLFNVTENSHKEILADGRKKIAFTELDRSKPGQWLPAVN